VPRNFVSLSGPPVVLAETDEALIFVQKQKPGLTTGYPAKKPTVTSYVLTDGKLLLFPQDNSLQKNWDGREV